MTKEKLKKEYFKILLEEIKDQVKLVLEGHSILDKKIEDLKELVREVEIKVEDTREAVKEIGRQLKEHMRLPAHVGI